MNIFGIVVAIAAAYIVLVFFGLRLFVPYMGFRRPSIPAELPTELLETVERLKLQSASAAEYLHKAYAFRRSRWHGGVFQTITHAPLAFRRDLSSIWNAPGFAHCTSLNYLLYILLVQSGMFRPADVRFRHAMQNFFIHQYLQIRVGGQWVTADTAPGIPLGKRNPLFG